MKMLVKSCIAAVFIMLLNGCFYFHRPWSYPMQVKIIDNAPCFTIAGDRTIRQHNPVNDSFMISKMINGTFETIRPTSDVSGREYWRVKPNECLQNNYKGWVEGHYSVYTAVRFDNNIDKRLYRVEFVLKRDPHTQQLNVSDIR